MLIQDWVKEMFDETKGIIICKGYKKPESIDKSISLTHMEDSDAWAVDNRLHKFINDEVWCEKEDKFYFLDGYVENISEIKACHDVNTWNQAFCKEWEASKVINLRGGFCGIIVGNENIEIFVDHTGNRSMYYYCKDDRWIISTRFFDIIELLKYNHVDYSIDEQAVKYMLTQGFMLDDTTFCKEVKRVCPGCIVTIDSDGTAKVQQYYKIDNTKINHTMSEKEAVDGIDFYFRQAVKREFSKDEEYGYTHLTDLSGGLDSRMTSWVAHDMGYTDQINLTYCRKNYLDFSIAQDIATDLSHTFLFMPLDDFKWYQDIDENTMLLNGASPYGASTGANTALKLLRGCNCGIEHTGMIGDAIIGAFYSDEGYNYARPDGREKAFSYMLDYEINNELLERYDNREQFSLYTRGLLGAQSSYMLRQNYFETASPFLDPDFLDFVMTIPLDYRKRHHIYFKWIESKYPNASKHGWESWYGLRPIENNRKIKKKIYEVKNKIKNIIYRFTGISDTNDMNPMDYWLGNNPEIKKETDSLFAENIRALCEKIDNNLIDDTKRLYYQGTCGEKMQALTVCAVGRIMQG